MSLRIDKTYATSNDATGADASGTGVMVYVCMYVYAGMYVCIFIQVCTCVYLCR